MPFPNFPVITNECTWLKFIFFASKFFVIKRCADNFKLESKESFEIVNPLKIQILEKEYKISVENNFYFKAIKNLEKSSLITEQQVLGFKV